MRIVVIHLERNTLDKTIADLADFMEEDSLAQLDNWINSDLMAVLKGSGAAVSANSEKSLPVIAASINIQNTTPAAKPAQAPESIVHEAAVSAKPAEPQKAAVSSGSMMMEETIPEVPQTQSVAKEEPPAKPDTGNSAQTPSQRENLVQSK